MSALDIRLFGPPRIRRDGVDVRFDTRKAVALIAVLAVTGREHGRDALAAMLWPDLDRQRARATLRRTLSAASAVGPALEITAAGARIDPAGASCDVREFQQLAGAREPDAWARAAEVAADGFLDGFALRDSPPFEEWQLATGDTLRAQLSQTLARIVVHAVRAGRMPAALGYARRRTQLDPLSEPAHADLIRVTAWTGDRPGALQAYRALVRRLDRELGVPPLPETVALHEAIRAGRLAPPPRVEEAPRRSRTAVATASTPAPAAAGLGTPALSAPALVARDGELARLDATWRDAAAAGGAVGLVGDPGVGKTALAQAFAARLGAPLLWITGRAAEQPLAFAAAGDLVRGMLALQPDLVAELGAAAAPLGVFATEMDADGAREIHTPGDLERVHEALHAAVRRIAARSGLLLVVDDAHLLDDSSAAALSYLLRRPPAGGLVIAVWRTGAGAASLPSAVVGAGETLAVTPLDETAVAELVAGTALDPAEVHRRTRGVALLVREFAASAAEGVGGSHDGTVGVRELVSARLDAASDIVRQIVGAAAVIGTVADPELLRAACGRDEDESVDAIEEAIARGLLVERADRPGYDLPHELVRDAALARLSLARRRLLHSRIADVLARRNTVDPRTTPAGLVARHLAEAGRDEEAATRFLAAAAESERLYAHGEALEQLRQARALGHRLLDVHHATGTVLVRLGRYDEALVAFDQATALAEADPLRAAELEHATAGVRDRLGDWVLAQAHLEAARDLAGDSPKRARILADLALVQHRRGAAAAAEETAAAAARTAQESGDGPALAQATNVLGMLAAARGDRAGASVVLAEAVALARRIADAELLIAALNNLSRVRQASGDADGALDAAREACDLAQRQGDRHRLAALHSHVADLLHAAGRDDEAMAELKRSAEAFGQVQGARARPEVWTLTEW